MSDDSIDGFLRDLQIQCLNEFDDYSNEMQAALATLPENPDEALTNLLKTLHNLKGNVQAVGFIHFGTFIHDMEAILVRAKELISKESVDKIRPKLSDLEFRISKTVESVDAYRKKLKTDFTDSEERMGEWSKVLEHLGAWNLTSTGGSVNFDASSPQTEDGSGKDANVVVAKINSHEDAEEQLSAMHYLLCKNQDREFGVPVSRVIEIIQFAKLSMLPSTRHDVIGIMNLRGEVIPILNLGETFGAQKLMERSFIVICQSGASRFGFPMEDARQIEELDPNEFSPNQYKNTLVSHVCVKGEQTILIVDIDRIIAA